MISEMKNELSYIVLIIIINIASTLFVNSWNSINAQEFKCIYCLDSIIRATSSSKECERYRYDSTGHLSEIIYTQSFNSRGGIRHKKIILEYDSNGNNIIRTDYYIIDGVQVPYHRFIAVYNSNNARISYDKYVYEGKQWIKRWREENSYDKKGNLLETVLYRINEDQSTFNQVHRKTYRYNRQNRLIEEMTWSTGIRELFKYDRKSKIIAQYSQCNNEDSWTEMSAMFYQYDRAGNMIKKQQQTDTNQPKGYGTNEFCYSYDALGNLIRMERANTAHYTGSTNYFYNLGLKSEQTLGVHSIHQIITDIYDDFLLNKADGYRYCIVRIVHCSMDGEFDLKSDLKFFYSLGN